MKKATAGTAGIYDAIIDISKQGHRELAARVAPFLSSATPFLREAAVRALVFHLRSPGHKADAVRLLTQDPDRGVRAAAAMGLNTFAMTDPGLVGQLVDVALDAAEAEAVRDAAFTSALVGAMSAARAAVAVVALLAAGCQRDADVAPRGPAPPGGDGHQLHSRGAPAMTITLDRLRTWSEQLCTLPALDFAGALAALGVTGSLVNTTSDYSIVEPPPAGASRLALTRENLGRNKGNLGEVEVTLDGVPITRGELDARFGAGNVAPRVDYDRPYIVAYDVERAGAPFRCTMLASFPDEPTAASVATQISLLRNMVPPPRAGQATR